MGKSGLATMLLLVAGTILVMLAVMGRPGGIRGLWMELTGQVPAPTVPMSITDPRAMSGGDGMRKVEQVQREMNLMDSLAGSVHRPGTGLNP